MQATTKIELEAAIKHLEVSQSCGVPSSIREHGLLSCAMGAIRAEPIIPRLVHRPSTNPNRERGEEYRSQPRRGLVYLFEFYVEWDDVVKCAQDIIKNPSKWERRNRALRGWAGAVIDALDAGKQLHVAYTGETTGSVEFRCEHHDKAHLRVGNPSLLGEFLTLFGLERAGVLLALDGPRMERAYQKFLGDAKALGFAAAKIKSVAFEDFLGFGESAVAAIYETRYTAGGANVGPTSGKPYHPNIPLVRLAKAVCDNNGWAHHEEWLSKAKQLVVEYAMAECGGKEQWHRVVGLMRDYGGGPKTTIEGLLTLVASAAGGCVSGWVLWG